MDDDLTRLEAMLRAKAAEVPYVQAAPASVFARGRRRVARTTLALFTAGALVVIGASAGLGAFRDADRVVPGSSSPSAATPSTTSCTSADLRATAALDGAAGSVVGSIELTNAGAGTCTLSGRPRLTLTSPTQGPLSPAVSEVLAQWQVDGTQAPAGWPVVTLRPGAVASIRVRWSNPCPQLTSPVVWHVHPGDGGGGLEVAGAEAIPSCLGSGQPSTLDVGPFEPRIG
jgi:hypothetical protein